MGRRPGARFFEKYTADFEKMFNSSTRVVKTTELYVNCPDLHFQSFLQVNCVQKQAPGGGKPKKKSTEKKNWEKRRVLCPVGDKFGIKSKVIVELCEFQVEHLQCLQDTY